MSDEITHRVCPNCNEAYRILAGHSCRPRVAEIRSIIPAKNTGLAPSNAAIAAELRGLADWIEDPEGGFVPINRLLVIIEAMDGGLQRFTYGHPMDMARIIGLLHMATHRAMYMGDTP